MKTLIGQLLMGIKMVDYTLNAIIFIPNTTVDGQKIKPSGGLSSKAPGPTCQCCMKLYIASSLLGFDFFVHRPQARNPKATLKFGDARVTTIEQGLISSSF